MCLVFCALWVEFALDLLWLVAIHLVTCWVCGFGHALLPVACLFGWFDVGCWLVDLALMLSFARCLGVSVCPSCVICNNDGRFGSGATDGALSG